MGAAAKIGAEQEDAELPASLEGLEVEVGASARPIDEEVARGHAAASDFEPSRIADFEVQP